MDSKNMTVSPVPADPALGSNRAKDFPKTADTAGKAACGRPCQAALPGKYVLDH
jgi:hypothetical protein